jgi:hypothetical protein
MAPAAIKTMKKESAVSPKRLRSEDTYLYSTDSGTLVRTTAETVRALAADGLAAGELAVAGRSGVVDLAPGAGGVPPYRDGVLL